MVLRVFKFYGFEGKTTRRTLAQKPIALQTLKTFQQLSCTGDSKIADAKCTLEESIIQVWLENDLKLRRRIAKLTGDWQVVEDLMQDLFVKVYRNRSKLSGDLLVNYMMSSASNIARDCLRKLKREKLIVEDSFQNYDNPEDLVILNERLEFYESQVEPKLGALPDAQKEALLAYANGDNLAYEARKLGVAYATVRSRRDAALKKLREEIPKRSVPK